MADKKKQQQQKQQEEDLSFRPPEIIEVVKAKPRKSSFLSATHPNLPDSGPGSPVVGGRKKSVGFRPSDVVIIQEQFRHEQQQQMAASPPDDHHDREDTVDAAAAAADAEVAGFKVGSVEEASGEDGGGLFARFKVRPPTPPGVSHKKAEVKLDDQRKK